VHVWQAWPEKAGPDQEVLDVELVGERRADNGAMELPERVDPLLVRYIGLVLVLPAVSGLHAMTSQSVGGARSNCSTSAPDWFGGVITRYREMVTDRQRRRNN
jgi:hypothetical protein